MAEIHPNPRRRGDKLIHGTSATRRNIRPERIDPWRSWRFGNGVCANASRAGMHAMTMHHPAHPPAHRPAGSVIGRKDDNQRLNPVEHSSNPLLRGKPTSGIHNMLRKPILALVFISVLSACDKAPDTKAAAAAKDAERPLLIAPEDLHTVKSNALASGPAITGSIQPDRRADLRAELSAVVMQVLKENGDAVRKGDLLVRMDDTSIRDSLNSADAGARAATQSFDQAERQFQRMSTLRTSGMASAQALDDAENRRNAAQSEREAARARAVQARQQLTRTEVRAPFDGIVSDRKVSAGDTAQIGKELLKVIDPASMRFEGMVSADAIGSVKTGQQVTFRVNGYGDQDFAGKVRRVNPAANAVTRQVEVLVDFTEKKQPKLAGLYAEGRVETESTSSLTIPATSLIRDGEKALAWRVKGNTLQKVPIKIGERDARSGDYPLSEGVTEGDKLLRHPGATLKEGQKVEMTPSASAKLPAPATKAAANATSTKN